MQTTVWATGVWATGGTLISRCAQRWAGEAAAGASRTDEAGSGLVPGVPARAPTSGPAAGG